MKDAKILLIEDNSSDAELASITFEELNLLDRTKFINNGADALDYLKELQDDLKNGVETSLRIVFLDIMLPKLNGFEILEQLETQYFQDKVALVIFSSSEIFKDVNRAYELGVNCYMVKPIDFFQHQFVLKSAINFWL